VQIFNLISFSRDSFGSIHKQTPFAHLTSRFIRHLQLEHSLKREMAVPPPDPPLFEVQEHRKELGESESESIDSYTTRVTIDASDFGHQYSKRKRGEETA
jgi:hypothetical protein